MRQRYFSTLLMISLFTASVCSAQDETPLSITNQNRSGDLPFSTTIGSDVEHVDVVSGALTVNIPFMAEKGRHLDFKLGFHYTSGFWVTAVRNYPSTPEYETFNFEMRNTVGGVGWEPNQAYLTYINAKGNCGTFQVGGRWVGQGDPISRVESHSNFIYHDEAGGKHLLAARSAFGSCGEGGFEFEQSGPDLTGQGMHATISGSGMTPEVKLANGTKVSTLGGTGSFSPTGVVPYNYDGNLHPWGDYVDANGNALSQDVGGQDTLGRTPLSSTSSASLVTYSFPDTNGVTRTVALNNGTQTFATAFNATGPYGPVVEVSGSAYVVNSIVLPNGQSYSFQYESGSYLGMTRINLPSGGYVTYTWGTFTEGDHPQRYVTSRTVHDGGQSFTWNISRICSMPNGVKCDQVTTTVTDPLGNQSTYVSTHGALNIAKIYSGGAAGTPLREYDLAYTEYPDPINEDPESRDLRSVVTKWQNGAQTKKEFDYEPPLTYNWIDCDGGNGGDPENCAYEAQFEPLTTTPFTMTRGNVTEIREFDFGVGAPGSLLRRTRNCYLHNDQDPNDPYVAANIVDRITAIAVFATSAGQNPCSTNDTLGQISLTRFVYDNGRAPYLTQTSGVPGHDYTNFPASNVVRGNVTQVKKWRDSYQDYAITTYNYDDLGNITSIVDPLGHITTYDYNDAWPSGSSACLPSANTRAFVTQVTNAAGQHINVRRFPCTGLVQSHQDQNDINASRAGTTYTYDLVGRMLSKNAPDGGQISTSYVDSLPLSSTTSTLIDSSHALRDETVLDDLGRVKQTQLLSDPQGTVFQDTTYDEFGRKHTISNPYRSGDTTFTTAYVYDVLGRTTQVTEQDGGIVRTDFDQVDSAGRDCTLSTDEAGTKRKACSDALGRLKAVWEDPAALNYETDYTYDALGNLTCVEQHGGVSGTGCTASPASDASSPWRVRRFTYNSLSQLITAKNPESGTICYGNWSGSTCMSGYDYDGNLVNKTDARGIVQSYTYDSLHRFLRRQSQSDPNDYSQNVYDETGTGSTFGLNVQNGIGRRTSFYQPYGGASFSYDPVGRTSSVLRAIDSPTRFLKTISYTYNQDGSLQTLTYPSGRVVAYTPDSAAHIQQIADSTNTYFSGLSAAQLNAARSYNAAACPNLPVLNVCYAADGSFYAGSYGWSGSYAGTLMMQWLNPRGFPVRTWALLPNLAKQFDLSYDFHWGTGGNGNVFAITNGKDSNRSTAYTYDSLNRVQTAQTPTSTRWGTTYTYDAWGNLLSGVGIAGKTASETSNYGALPDNRSSLIGEGNYDAAGNVINDGFNVYTFDAENHIVTASGTTYRYDADGERVQKCIGTFCSETYWYGADGQVLSEADGSGNLQHEYIYYGGDKLARVDLPELAVANSGFESGLTNWVSGQNPQLVTDPVGAHSGSNYIKLSTSTSASVTSQNVFPVTPGQYIVFGGWTYRESGNGYARWKIIAMDANHAPVTYPSPSPADATPANQWVFQQGGYTVPASGVAYVQLYAEIYQATQASVARFDDGFINGTFYLFHDNVHTTDVVLDAKGNLRQEFDYGPFGRQLYTITNQLPNQRYWFDGKERDVETGLDYFGARYYRSNMGRFLSPDWAAHPTAVPYADFGNPQSLNLYSFAKNNPTTFADLDGHFTDYYDQKGKRLGSDGIKNNRYEIVTNKKEADQIRKDDKAGKNTPASSVKSGFLLPSKAVRTEAGAVASRMATPNATDRTGGFHEEASTVGHDASGNEIANQSQPGPTVIPTGPGQTLSENFNSSNNSNLVDVEAFIHGHPGGTANGFQWNQEPSPADHQAAPGGVFNIVVGGGNNTVYFYNSSSSTNIQFPLGVLTSLP